MAENSRSNHESRIASPGIETRGARSPNSLLRKAAGLGPSRRNQRRVHGRARVRKMRVRRFVGDPDQLPRLHIQPLSERLDDARRPKGNRGRPVPDGQCARCCIRAGGDLAGAEHAERAAGPFRLGDVVQALDETTWPRMRVLYKTQRRSVHFRTRFRRGYGLRQSDEQPQSKASSYAPHGAGARRCSVDGRKTMPIAMTAEEASLYARDGYLLRKGLLSPEEVGQVSRSRARAARTGTSAAARSWRRATRRARRRS